jgi:hypothetical protein
MGFINTQSNNVNARAQNKRGSEGLFKSVCDTKLVLKELHIMGCGTWIARV